MPSAKLGIIGGSGLYEMSELKDVRWQEVQTEWGAPSDALCCGTLHGLEVAFLPRHARGHKISPSDINYRANIAALKKIGVTDIVSVSACGSLREDYRPGDFVITTQFIDRTSKRISSFFGTGCVAHVSMAQPVCARLGDMLFAGAGAHNISIHREGVCVVMEGPQFSSLGESQLYRQWKSDTINMTQMPEAKLAREAELPYATLAIVTDYDCWHPREAAVDVEQAIARLNESVEKSRLIVGELAKSLAAFGDNRPDSPQDIEHTLDTAIITAPDARDPALMKKLKTIMR